VRESETIPLSALVGAEDGDEGPSVDPERFLPASHSRWPGHWASPPRSWAEIPEAQLLSKETRALIESVIEALPPMQAQVIALRDVEGWTAEDVCALLDLSAANQRVLLHRARRCGQRSSSTWTRRVRPR
jgi:RNA polymerase sigma-70 factor, ECF subfamily